MSDGKPGGIGTWASSAPEARANGDPVGPAPAEGEVDALLPMPGRWEQAAPSTRAARAATHSADAFWKAILRSTRDERRTDHPAPWPGTPGHRFTAQEHVLDGEVELVVVQGAVPLPRVHFLRPDAGAGPGIDDHQVGVEPGRNRPFALLEAGELGRSLADPSRRQPDAAHVFGQLEAAQIQGLNAWAARGNLFERPRLLVVGVRRVVCADHPDHPPPEAVEQRGAVRRGADRRKHPHRS